MRTALPPRAIVEAPRRTIGVGGFTLVEAMAAIALSGVLLVNALATYNAAQRTRADGVREWEAFTVAQSQMEMLAAARTDDAVLADTAPDSIAPDEIATELDAHCTTGVDNSLTPEMKVDALGFPISTGKLTLCWKVTAGHPTGNLKNIRVVVGYPASGGGMKHVLLQTLR